jgi:hypothetical protein
LINTIGAARKRAYDAITLDEAPLPSLVSSNDITISRDLTNGYVAPNKRARTINGTGTGGAVPSSSSGTGITIPAGAVLVMPSNDRPVRDLNDPLFWSLAFPTLFWRGIGVPGQPRQHVISLREWAKHVMKSCYHHYRLHRSFPFVLMSNINRLDALQLGRLRIKSSIPAATLDVLNNLKSDDVAKILKLVDPLTGRLPDGVIPPPGTEQLLRQVHASGSKMNGSDASRSKSRQELGGIMIYNGPPQLFVTINPSDTTSVLVAFFSGVPINDISGMSWFKRAQLAANDPVASVKFFQTVINGFLHHLLRPSSSEPYHTTPGIFGRVKSWYGTIEAQGRGSLHLHILIWLRDCPSPDVLWHKLGVPSSSSSTTSGDKQHVSQLLQDELTVAFRERFLAYLESIMISDIATIPADYPAAPSSSSVDTINSSVPTQPLPTPAQLDDDPLLNQQYVVAVNARQQHGHGHGVPAGADVPKRGVGRPRAPRKASVVTTDTTTGAATPVPVPLPPLPVAPTTIGSDHVSTIATTSTTSDPSTSTDSRESKLSGSSVTAMELPFDASHMTSSEFMVALKERSALIAKKAQYHKPTHTATCYKYAPSRASKDVKARCRFGFPRKLIPQSCIIIGGSKRRAWQLTLRRRHRWVNTYNHILSAALSCNVDITFLLSGADAKASVCYATDYITKRSKQTHNNYMYAYLALRRSEAADMMTSSSGAHASKRVASMITRCLNQFVGAQERSAAEIFNVLLGYKDHFTNESFVPLFIPNYVKQLDWAFTRRRSQV